ncbi:peptidoglycan-binding protein [Streptomyces qinzhouensis]|uniref:N-acetylmuramoyl-L-alanine amidase n=1 Tax=Streptomyces qinzhouensis TaxID=2599401 RepID=A0A5B8JAU3_9ACTN|nr:peptidoglycan-binding protein [Streptomyces qinzhouensis]QDY78497.1 N-acetylmuramoyl-L-alanine amidase [Streptomyces qinzhouensis]
MATPLTADRLVAALRAEGLDVVERPGWRGNHRDHAGAFGPVHGVMVHHTVSTGTEASVDLCFRGHATLPGPLCHAVIAKDGSVHLVGNGRANHAGGGDPDVLRAVANEKYGTRPPPPDEHQGSPGAVDGNIHFYGFECVNLGDGKDPWPAAQLDAIERASAALCRAHGWTAKSVIGHLEWTNRKIDPRGFTMPGLRARVARRLGSKPTGPAEPARPGGPRHHPFPGTAFFKAAPSSPVITAMGRRLVAEGCGEYTVGPGPRWSEADRRSYARWQRKLGFRGADADGWPGPSSWNALKVPRTR